MYHIIKIWRTHLMNVRMQKIKHFIFLTLCLSLIFFIFNDFSICADTLTENYKPVITGTYVNKANGTITIQWSIASSDYDYFLIYRSLSQDGEYEPYDDTTSLSYIDYDADIGITYYYKIVTVKENHELEEDFSEPACTGAVSIPLTETSIQSIKPVKSHGLEITWNISADADGYGIYRSEQANGTYILIQNVKNETTWYWDFEDQLTYTDKNLTVGKVYYYRIRPYVTYSGINYYSNYSSYKTGQPTINATSITKAVSKKKSTNTISWKALSEADGYIIYYAKKYNGKYKKLKTISGKKKVSYTHKKLKNGTAYYYKVYGYKKISGKKLLSCEPEVYQKYCDYFTYADEPYESRLQRIFGNSKTKWYKTASKARKNMKTVKIKVWDIDSKGKKYTRVFYVTVHKNLAPSVKQMFKEIYKTKERFPIHDIGCYNWRGKGSTSEHCIGTAFDINANENYMIDNGQVLSGSFWSPKKSQYSIPLKCDLVKILEKYGFSRGFWGSRKDYMHFSYFGT